MTNKSMGDVLLLGEGERVNEEEGSALQSYIHKSVLTLNSWKNSKFTALQ